MSHFDATYCYSRRQSLARFLYKQRRSGNLVQQIYTVEYILNSHEVIDSCLYLGQ